MYAKLYICGKHKFVAKSGKTLHVVYAQIIDSQSEYDVIEEGFKTVTAFVREDIYKDVNRKDQIIGNLTYKDGNASFWPYGINRKVESNAEETVK